MWFLAGLAGIVIGALTSSFVIRRALKSVDVQQPSETIRAAAQGTTVVTAAQLLPLDRVMNVLPVGVFVADADGELIYRNRLALAVTGVRHLDILASAATQDCLAQARLHGNARQRVELNGPPRRHFEVEAWRLPEDTLERTVAVVIEVTERSRIDSVRTDFVANISHELKTPLGAASVLAETLVDEVSASTPHLPTARRLAERVVHENLRLAKLVDELLDLAAIELGGAERCEELDLCQVVHEAESRVRGAASLREVPLVVEVPETAIIADGDRAQLVSAFANLLDNAVKYSESASPVAARLTVVGDEAMFAVTDHGVGIPKADLERIFERFYRVDRARSRATGGTGLGLSIVRHVANNHGGRVTVESVEGEGATFAFRFPRKVKA